MLLSQRSLESDRQNRTRALPVGELTRTVAIPSKARLKELVSGVKSSGQTARIAAALLTQPEDMPVRPRVRAMDDQGKPSLPSEAGLSTSARRWL